MHQLPRTDILIFHGRACKCRSKTVRPCQRMQLQTLAVHNLNQRWNGRGRAGRGRARGRRTTNLLSALHQLQRIHLLSSTNLLDKIRYTCTAHTRKIISKATNPRPMCAYERGRRSNNWGDEKPRENCGKPKFQFVGMRV